MMTSPYFSHLGAASRAGLTNRQKAERWVRDNPKGWDAFHRFSLEARRAGRERISIAMVRERVRWEVYFIRKETFKISNSYSPILARMLMTENPDLEGLFEIHEANLA